QRTVRSCGARITNDPTARAALQPTIEVMAPVHLPQADRRTVPSLGGDTRDARRRLLLPRPVPIDRGGTLCTGGDRRRGSAPALRPPHRQVDCDQRGAALCSG